MTDWSDISIPILNRVKGSEPSVTFYLTKAKTINLHLGSALMRREEDKEYVILGHSAKNNAIVLFFTVGIEQPNARKLSKRATSATTSVQTFLNACALDKKMVEGKYPAVPEVINGKQAWIIYLNNKTP